MQCKIKIFCELCVKAEKPSVKAALFKGDAVSNTCPETFSAIFDLKIYTGCLGAERQLVVHIHRIKVAHILPSLWILQTLDLMAKMLLTRSSLFAYLRIERFCGLLDAGIAAPSLLSKRALSFGLTLNPSKPLFESPQLVEKP